MTLRAFLPLLALAAAMGCQNKDATPSAGTTDPASSAAAPNPAAAAPSGSAAAGPAAAFPVGIPRPASDVAKIINPRGEEPYRGPTAKLKGTVRIKGDPPPSMDLTFPVGKCGEAAATYGKLFRVGLEGAAADVLVAVTGYKGFVPQREEAEKTTLHGCAFARRTMAVAFGQRVEVSNLDQLESYMPYLDGAPKKAVMVAVPRGEAVKLFPMEPGHYMLRDELPKPFLHADVFVLAYATHDVTGLDGQYEISGIPVGDVVVNAFLPTIDKTVEQRITLKEGDNALDLTLEYTASKDGADAKKAGSEAKPGDKKP
ncbi:hypothetical protein [Polyangium aurulentum]|uniref:hypothetical protein n=1 Tax=Polyangium aurulentum TaxID=2567896 RepID=UPI001F3DAB10|nr:hypothetical protein [Polyangium aurulentum]